MRKTLAALAVVALALAGCGTTGEDEATVTKTPASSSKSTTSATPEPSVNTEPPEETEVQPSEPLTESPVPEAAPSAAKEPQIASCATDPMLYQRGTTWFTDGTSGWTQTCADQMPAPQDLSTVPFADGGTCAAAICGYGHDENGNPNKSSGEIQTEHGCEQGYITDPELCAAVGY